MRFLGIIFGVLGLILAGYTTTRIWGASQSFVPFDHALLNYKGKTVIIEAEDPTSVEALAKADEGMVIALPVRLTKDGVAIVMKDETWAKLQTRQNYIDKVNASGLPLSKVQHFSLDELLSISPAIHKLEGYLQSYPQKIFILLITDNVESIQNKVMEVVEKSNPKGSLAVASPIEGVLKSIKDIRPLTAFSLSQSEQVRLLSFDSIGLISAMGINGDFVYSKLSWNNRPLLTLNLSKEMHRRFKKVFVGPLTTTDEVLQAKGLEADGYVFPDIQTYENLKDQISK